MNAPAEAPAPRRRWFPVLVAAGVVAATIIVVNSSFSGGMYDYPLDKIAGRTGELVGQQIRVNGKVEPGSVHGDRDKLDVSFALTDGKGHRLQVHYARLLPDPFAEGRDVIVEGTIQPNGVLEGSNLTVKCPSRYQDANLDDETIKAYYRKHHGSGAAPSSTAR